MIQNLSQVIMLGHCYVFKNVQELEGILIEISTYLRCHPSMRFFFCSRVVFKQIQVLSLVILGKGDLLIWRCCKLVVRVWMLRSLLCLFVLDLHSDDVVWVRFNHRSVVICQESNWMRLGVCSLLISWSIIIKFLTSLSCIHSLWNLTFKLN